MKAIDDAKTSCCRTRSVSRILVLAILFGSLATSASSTEAPRQTRSGDPESAIRVYVNGNPIAPPYLVSRNRDTVAINGVIVFPGSRTGATPGVDGPALPGLKSATSARLKELSADKEYAIKRVFELWHDMGRFPQSTPNQAILEHLIGELESYSFVDSVRETSVSNELRIIWSASHAHGALTEELVVLPLPRKDRKERSLEAASRATGSIESHAETLERHLSQGGLILVQGGSTTYLKTTGGKSLGDWQEIIREAQQGQLRREHKLLIPEPTARGLQSPHGTRHVVEEEGDSE